jgi:hypothetical protein
LQPKCQTGRKCRSSDKPVACQLCFDVCHWLCQ